MDRRNDGELLRSYTIDRSEVAFSELMGRHYRLVYAVCRAEVGEADAEDAAQAVFLILARRASMLSRRPSVAGWLYETSRLVCRNILRRNRAALRREAQMQRRYLESEAAGIETGWTPTLEDALRRLNAVSREAILLRYCEELTLAEVGERLNLSEDAARMRVGRALGSLRRHLTKRGAFGAVAGCEDALGGRRAGVGPAPPATLHAASSMAQIISRRVLHTMTMNSIKMAAVIAVGSLCIVAGGLHAAGLGGIAATPSAAQGDPGHSVQASAAPAGGDNQGAAKKRPAERQVYIGMKCFTIDSAVLGQIKNTTPNAGDPQVLLAALTKVAGRPKSPSFLVNEGSHSDLGSGGEIPVTTVVNGKTVTRVEPYGMRMDFSPTLNSNNVTSLAVWCAVTGITVSPP